MSGKLTQRARDASQPFSSPCSSRRRSPSRPGRSNRAALRTTLTYRVVPQLSLGIEYDPLAGKVSPLANWLAVTETERRPTLIFDTSSDRIGLSYSVSFSTPSLR